MITSLIILSALCADTKIYNVSSDPWNETDVINYAISTKRCPEKYPRSPCLKKFTKIRENTYKAICGKEIK